MTRLLISVTLHWCLSSVSQQWCAFPWKSSSQSLHMNWMTWRYSFTAASSKEAARCRAGAHTETARRLATLGAVVHWANGFLDQRNKPRNFCLFTWTSLFTCLPLVFQHSPSIHAIVSIKNKKTPGTQTYANQTHVILHQWLTVKEAEGRSEMKQKHPKEDICGSHRASRNTLAANHDCVQCSSLPCPWESDSSVLRMTALSLKSSESKEEIKRKTGREVQSGKCIEPQNAKSIFSLEPDSSREFTLEVVVDPRQGKAGC